MKDSTPAVSAVDAYLERLALDREPPSVDALGRLHRAHAERIPYETLWIHLGEAWSAETNDALRRIAFEQRGGYCFHLNGAFHHLLTALGYNALRHVGAVSGPDGPTPDELANHLALTVRNVPSADPTTHGLDWYVDLGLGDGLYEPMPLRAGDRRQAPMNFTLSEVGDGRWRLNHDPELGAFSSMTFNTEPTEMSAFVARHHELATSPESPFVRTVTAQRRDANGVDALRGLVLERVGDVPSRTDLLTADEWYTALSEVFGLPLTHVSVAARTALWNGVKAKHDAWAQRQDERSGVRSFHRLDTRQPRLRTPVQSETAAPI